ncbi:glycoside hydrolase family 5 [Catenulispora acidiphila DSM 44928]|uniref:Glycoside hydrolase family 5 n=1 Tax=Catenulispora acidiphila (strain DSM 44928 / JCM 14897 / NBRC 102108 / NRRL B-24433 / ID139908) TaxID=479433 RepID=C7Q2F2_CATAD|nr:cellulase family glycosylhydrolase [Catenulispora acidiphila]ACU69794.1 glycoside hydrolase family 5 [Catenulispora acidiphila DSM 44928]
MSLIRVRVLIALLALLTCAVLLPGSARAASRLPSAAAVPAGSLAASWTGPLSTSGRYVVDANGNRFKLIGGNWDGAQGHWLGSGSATDPAQNHAGEVSYNVPLALDRKPIPQILADFHSLGINTIRLPFADAMIHDTSTVPDAAVTANPQLRGLTALQVYDAVVSALTGDGFAVILNNHTTSYRWCCGLDGNERWNSGQSTQQWESDWLFMVNRYRANKRVVGADLRNEVRRDTWDDPNWGWYDAHDEYAAFEEAGNQILAADPDMLIVMEGINWYGIPAAGFSHGRPMLTPAANLSATLIASNKLVYSAHFYSYTGPNNSGAAAGSAGSTSDPRYEDMTPDQLASAVNQEALFVTQSGQHFTAPVWVSEFGAAGRGETDTKEQTWLDTFTTILAANDTDFAIWPLIGYTATNGTLQDNWALLSYDPAGNRTSITDPGDWRLPDWQKLTSAPTTTGHIPASPHWNMLDLDHADYNVSTTMLAQPDWSPGNRKGNCPDTERLTGLGRGSSRGLCTDSSEPTKSTATQTVVTNETYVTEGDWAPGYTKLQCPDNTFATGYSVHNNAMAALLCAPAAAPLPTTSHTIWFNQGDNRPTTGGSTPSDWAPGSYKGQCPDNEYLAGIAYTWQRAEGGVPDALLCRALV